MPTVARLRGRRAFTDLAQQGRTVRSGPLRVRYLAAPGAPAVGFAIGKKVGGAVDRNRIRRRLRAAVTEATVPLTCGFYVFSADPAVRSIPFADLVAAVENAVEKVDK